MSKVARRFDKKSEIAGFASSSSHQPAVSMVSTEAAAKEAIRIAKLQKHEDDNIKQQFHRPGDHLWELVNGNMKWRLRYDQKSYEEQQEFISASKSRFCAGVMFDKFHLDPEKGGKGLGYGEKPGPVLNLSTEVLKNMVAQSLVMSR